MIRPRLSACLCRRRPVLAGYLAMLLVPMLGGATPVRAQTLTVLYRFHGGRDGASPNSRLVLDDAGNLYGTARDRGAYNFGTVFKLDANGKLTTLHAFNGIDGLWPSGDLIRDKKGNLYGTTAFGATPEGGKCRHGCGTLFKIDSSGKHRILHIFSGDADGGGPAQRLIRDDERNFYGVAYRGGNRNCGIYRRGCGVIFRIDATGTESVLYTFGQAADGGNGVGDLIRDKVGNIFGTTNRGGDYTWGSVFKLDPEGTWTTLYSFTGFADGNAPTSGLIRDENGSFYGSTQFGGDPTCGFYLNGCGVIFKLDSANSETVLYTFTGDPNQGEPFGALLRDASGNLYGTSYPGAVCDPHCGNVFKLDPSGNKTILHEFNNPSKGLWLGHLTRDKAGNLYGTTWSGGRKNDSCYYGCGVIFKIVP